ncbi:hypothetical protein Tco_0212599 [Tanacetum coccineum]
MSALRDSIKSLTSIRAAPSDTCSVSALCSVVSARCYAASALARDALISCSIYAHNFLTCLQKLSSYASGHLEVSLSWLCSRRLSTYSARLRSSSISSLVVTRNSCNSLASYLAYYARSCDRVILPLAILSESRVTTSCYSNNLTLARRVIVSCMKDVKLARRVSMSSSTNSMCSGGGGATGGGDGGSDGEGDLDLLRDEDGKSEGDGEDDDGKSGSGGEDDDGISNGSSG